MRASISIGDARIVSRSGRDGALDEVARSTVFVVNGPGLQAGERVDGRRLEAARAP